MSLRRLTLTLIACAAFCLTPPAHAQGCTQCRDNAAATSPQTQAAYRHAIILMTGTASTLFLTTLVIFKRQR
jgi:hypothetical protein